MSIDINKVIMESIADTITETKDNDVQTLTESTNHSVTEGTMSFDNANRAMIASAISAGLGAMNFRNHIRTLTEALSPETKDKLKTAGKVAAGVGGTALALGGLYKAAKEGMLGDNAQQGANEVGGYIKRLSSRFSDEYKPEDVRQQNAIANNALKQTVETSGKLAGADSRPIDPEEARRFGMSAAKMRAEDIKKDQEYDERLKKLADFYGVNKQAPKDNTDESYFKKKLSDEEAKNEYLRKQREKAMEVRMKLLQSKGPLSTLINNSDDGKIEGL